MSDDEVVKRLLELIDRTEAVAGIRRGLEDVRHGRTRPVAEALEEIRRKYRIPREEET